MTVKRAFHGVIMGNYTWCVHDFIIHLLRV